MKEKKITLMKRSISPYWHFKRSGLQALLTIFVLAGLAFTPARLQAQNGKLIVKAFDVRCGRPNSGAISAVNEDGRNFGGAANLFLVDGTFVASDIISSGSSTPTYFENLGAGVYELHYDPNRGAFKVYTVEIKDPNVSNLNASANSAGIITVEWTGEATELSIEKGGTTVESTTTGLEDGTYTSSALGAGTYDITVRDNCGGTHTTQVEVVPVHTELDITVDEVIDGCASGEDANKGTIEVSWSDGTPPFTANLLSGGTVILTESVGSAGDPGPFSASFFPVPAGTYQVEVEATDGGSSGSTGDIVVEQLEELTITAAEPNNICFGAAANSGSIDLEWTGTAQIILINDNNGGGSTYAENLEGGSLTAGQLEAGTYTVIIEDVCGNEVSTDVEILQLDELAITAAEPNNICFGAAANSGSIDLEWTGTAQIILINDNNGGGSTYAENLEGGSLTAGQLTAGTYTVIIEDVCGNEVSTDVEIKQLEEVALVEASSEGICFGEEFGNIYVEWSGEIQSLAAVKTDGPGGEFIDAGLEDGNFTFDLRAGTYDIILRSQCGDITTQVEIEIKQTEAPIAIDGERCGPGVVELSVDGCPMGIIKWYNEPTGGPGYFASGRTITPFLDATDTFYASCTIDGCESPRTPVTGYINAAPEAPIAIDGERCGPGVVELSVDGCPMGIIKWYNEPTGGPGYFASGRTITPFLDATDTFYASCTIDGCESPRTPVTATVTSGADCCQFNVVSNLTATVDACSNQITVEWTGDAGAIDIRTLADAEVEIASEGLEDGSYTSGVLPDGTYKIAVVDLCQNVVETEIVVKSPEPLVAEAGPDVSVIIDNEGTNCGHQLSGSATGGKEPYTYYWFVGKFNNPNPSQADFTGQNWIVHPDSETTYTLLVVDDCSNGSVDQVTVFVEIHDGTFYYCEADRNKAYICHQTGNGRKYEKLCVNLHAIPAHMRHGDLLPSSAHDNCNQRGGSSNNLSAGVTTEQRFDNTLMVVYPNPFRELATVTVTTETAGRISLRLFDFSGKEVKVLYYGNSDAGQRHDLSISAENLVPGIYFCVLQDEVGVIKTEKLILQK